MRSAAFGLFVFLPLGGFLVWEYTDWSWMYLVDARKTPAWVSVLAVLTYPAAGLAGHLGTERLIRRGTGAVSPIELLPAAAGALGAAAVTLLLWDRLIVVGRYAEWELRLARPMWLHGPWMWDLFLVGTVIVGAFLVLARANAREGAAAASPPVA